MTRARYCCIKPLDNNYRAVTLPHKKIVYLGRNNDSGIQDLTIAKKQIALKANYKKLVVECVVEGVNPSGCNGFILMKNALYKFSHGDLLETGLQKYVYTIHFELGDNLQSGRQSNLFEIESSKLESVALQQISHYWSDLNHSLLVYAPSVYAGYNYIASFDLDGTLINTKSGDKFPKDKTDWKFGFDNVPKKLQDLDRKGYKLFIFTNQLRLSQQKQDIPNFKEKIENIIEKLKVPIHVFIATERDIYRKPAPGMWNELEKNVQNVDLDRSCYVGDAAGRAKNWAPGKPKDHSLADRLFAINIGIRFYTPEEFFLGARNVPYTMPEFDPRSVTSVGINISKPTAKELAIMVGSQGSGKSYFCINILIPMGYIYVNRDTLGSQKKCLHVVEENLRLSHNVVVDNTNPDVNSRKPFIEMAKKYNAIYK